MSEKTITWEIEALKQLENIPSFVRHSAKKIIEAAAMEAGEAEVTLAFMEANKSKLKG